MHYNTLSLAPSSPSSSPTHCSLEILLTPIRKYKSLLPPTDERETKAFQYVPGLFAFDQPLGVGIFQAGLRMTVVDLGNGDLWVHAPVGRTEELIALFDQVLTPGKRVAHIVIPNTSPEHSYYSAEWAAAFPDAQVWMPPGFDKFPAKAPEVDRMVKAGRCRVMSEEPPAEWNGAIEVACFKAGDTVFCECVFFVKAARALLTSDSCFFAKDDWVPNPISKFLAQASGIYQQLGAPALKPVFSTFKPEAQAWVARVLSFDFDMIVPAHVSGPVYDGKRQFKQAFSFVGDLRAV